MSEHAHGALGWLDQAGEQVEHGRLAAAGPAQHRDHFARRYRKAQAVDGKIGFVAPIAAQEALHHMAELDCRSGAILAAHAERSALGR